MKLEFDLALCVVQTSIFLIFVLAVWLFAWVQDRWRYAPWVQKVKCKRWGHDYHDGRAQNLVAEINGELFLYDFCQRCHEQSELRKPGQADDRQL